MPDLKSEEFTLSSRDTSLSSPQLPHPRLSAPQHTLLLHTSSSSRFLVRSLVSSEDIASGAHRSFMVQLCCLSAHRTLLSSSSLPSLLSPSCALARDSLSVTKATPPVSSRSASHLSASFSATVSASKELYPPPVGAAHRHTSVYLRLLPGHGAIRLYRQPATPPSLLQCSLRYLSLMCFRIRFLGVGIEHIAGKTALPRLPPPHTSARCSHGISTRGSKTVWHLCLQLFFVVLCLTFLSATSLLLSHLAAPSIYHTGVELQLHACLQLSPVLPPAGLLLWVYFIAFPTLLWLP